MTSAQSKLTSEDGRTPAGPLDVGSGRIDPNRAANPGLVVDTPVTDYVRYLKAQAPQAVPDSSITPLAAIDLNLPSVAFSRFTGSGSTVRTFTSVDSRPQSWTVSVEAPNGVLGTASPATFDIAPGATRAVTLTLTLAGAPTNTYTSGALVLTNSADQRTVRLPVSVQPLKVDAAPRLDVVTDRAAASAPLPVRVGYAGALSALGWGLAPGRVTAGQQVRTVAPDRDQPWAASDGVRIYDVEVPSGAQFLAAEISNVDRGATDTDLDLYLFRDRDGKGFGADDLVDRSGGPGATESIARARPEPGSYRFAVVGFRAREPASTYDFTVWIGADPTPDDPASPSTTPGIAVGGDAADVHPGDTVGLKVTWSDLTADGTWYGLVTYHDQTPVDPQAPIGATLVRIVKGRTADRG